AWARLRKRVAAAAPQRVNQLRHAAAAATVIGLAGANAGCSCGDDPTVSPACNAPGCMTLQYGLIGAYTSVAVHDGTVWVAGYAEADRNSGLPAWGDLAVGTWNGTSVEWEAIDGVPLEPAVDPTRYNMKGFRGGQIESGEDVGTWTSIAIGP